VAPHYELIHADGSRQYGPLTADGYYYCMSIATGSHITSHI